MGLGLRIPEEFGTRSRSPGPQMGSPDAQMASPDAHIMTSRDAQMASPDAQMASPDAQMASPDAQMASPDAQMCIWVISRCTNVHLGAQRGWCLGKVHSISTPRCPPARTL